MKLKYDKLLSNFAFNCNLRHYNMVCRSKERGEAALAGRCSLRAPGYPVVHSSAPHACFRRLNLKYDKLLSNFAFNCILCHYTYNEAIMAKAKHFDNAALSRDLSAVHVMVTGANQGIGYATCKQMANQKAHVHMVGRCSSTLL